MCRLKKTLYGLNQLARVWFERFSQAMVWYEYKQCQADRTHRLCRKDGRATILIVDVDDIVVIENDKDEINI